MLVIDGFSKWIEARIIDPTQRGRLDPLDTPHGLTCGLVKGLAIGTRISQYLDEKSLANFIENKLQRQMLKGKGMVTLNEKIVLMNVDLLKIEKIIKEYKLNKTLPTDLSIDYTNYKNGILNINIETGRVLRPLLVVSENKLNIDKY